MSSSPKTTTPADLISATNKVLNKSGAISSPVPLQTTAMIGSVPVPITSSTSLSSPLEKLEKLNSTIPSPGSGGLTPMISSSTNVSVPNTGATLIASPKSASPRRKKASIDIFSKSTPFSSPTIPATPFVSPVSSSSSIRSPIVPTPIVSPIVPPSPARSPIVPVSPIVPPSPARSPIVPVSPIVPPSPARSPMVPPSPVRSPIVPPSPVRSTIVPPSPVRSPIVPVSPIVPPSPVRSPIVPPSPSRSRIVPVSPIVPSGSSKSPLLPVTLPSLPSRSPSPVRSPIPLSPVAVSPSSFESIKLSASPTPTAAPLAAASIKSPSGLESASLYAYSSPNPDKPSIVGIISTDPSLTTLFAAVKAADLVDALSLVGPYTVFAPTNDAFAKIPTDVLSKLLADKQKLIKVLLYHVVPARVSSSEILDGNVNTLEGLSLLLQKTSLGVKIDNDTDVIGADILASNGIIHKIDKVLMPGNNVDAVQLSPSYYNVVSSSPKLMSPKIVSSRIPITPTLSRISSPSQVLESSIRGKSPLPSTTKKLDPRIDEVLFEKGYVIINVIQMGSGEVSFVQAFNRKGDICYIRINKWGAISFDLKDRSVVTVSPASTLSHSMKVSAVDCAKNSSCGVFFQCSGEMCYVNRDQEGKIEETSFVSVTKPSDSVMTQVGSPIAYPVVTFTEIEQDNEDAVRRVRLATINIQKQANLVCMEQLNNLCNELNYLSKCMFDFKMAAYKMLEFRSAETNRYLQLDSQYDSLRSQGILNVINQEKAKEVVSRLQNLSNVNTQLLGFIDEATRTTKEHIDTTKVITSDAYYSLYTEARKNYSDDVSGQLLKAEIWGLPEQMNRVDMKKSHANNYVDRNGNIVEVPLTKSVEKLNHSLGSL